jgi:tetratricopeptide (TPR) repeat protein
MADFITELRDRRILPAIGVYVASVWVVIEILDRLVERYLLSPYLSDIVFWGLYSLIPAVTVIAWTHGRPGKDKATRLEKVGVPINLIASIGLLFTAFGDKNFDLAASQVTFNNELGQQETHFIPSETFRRRMAIFFWNNESGDPQLDWLQYGITELLVQDLRQDPFVLANSPWTNFGNGFYARMRREGFDDGLKVPLTLMRKIANEANRQYFVEGSLDRKDADYVLTARIWDTQTLEQVAELESSGADIYADVDHLSRDIRRALDVPASSKRIAEDLPLKETYGDSEEALKAYIQGLNERLFNNDFNASNAFFDQATSIDQGFVLGWFVKAANLTESGNLPAAQEALVKAQALDYRLPARDRAQLKAMLYRLSGEHEKLMAFLNLQAKIRDDATSHNNLAKMLMISGELEQAKTEFLKALDKDALNVGIYLTMSTLERATGNMDAAIGYARKYQQQKPEDIEASLQLGDLLRDSGDLDGAEQQYRQALVLQNAPVRPTLKLAIIASRKGDVPAARRLLQEAEQFAKTPGDKTLVKQGVTLLEYRLGRIGEAIRQTYAQETFMRQSQGSLEIALSVYGPLADFFVMLGDYESAQNAIDQAKSMLSPPADKFMSFSAAVLEAKQHDFDAARSSLVEVREVIDQFKLKFLECQFNLVEAILNEELGEFKMAADHYMKAIEQIDQTVIANGLQIGVAQVYAQLANAQIKSGGLGAAEQSIGTGFRLDPSEPMLWLEQARLQQARNMPQLALASVNYALAIWNDADEDYEAAAEARALAAELQAE